MFVHPGQVGQIIRGFSEISRARLVLTGRIGADAMTLHCETADIDRARALSSRVVETARDVTRLRCEVMFVAPGTLPDDGKVIEDARDYS